MNWKRLGESKVVASAIGVVLAGVALAAAGRLIIAYRQRPSAKRKATGQRSTRAQAA